MVSDHSDHLARMRAEYGSSEKDGSVDLQGRDITLRASGRLEAKASGNVTIKGSKILQN